MDVNLQHTDFACNILYSYRGPNSLWNVINIDVNRIIMFSYFQHGRIKVKTTAEQQEAKRKEREKKLQLYNAGTQAAFKKVQCLLVIKGLLHHLDIESLHYIIHPIFKYFAIFSLPSHL